MNRAALLASLIGLLQATITPAVAQSWLQGWERTVPPGAAASYFQCADAVRCGDGSLVSYSRQTITFRSVEEYRVATGRNMRRGLQPASILDTRAFTRQVGDARIFQVERRLVYDDGRIVFYTSLFIEASTGRWTLVSSAETAELARQNASVFERALTGNN